MRVGEGGILGNFSRLCLGCRRSRAPRRGLKMTLGKRVRRRHVPRMCLNDVVIIYVRSINWRTYTGLEGSRVTLPVSADGVKQDGDPPYVSSERWVGHGLDFCTHSPQHSPPRGGTWEYPSPRGDPRLSCGQGQTNRCGRLSRLPCPKKTEYPRDKLPPMMDN